MKFFLIISFLIQILFSYSIFDHTNDFKTSSSSYAASFNNNQIYNFLNPACNTTNMDHIYSIIGNKFNGILENQQLYFSIHTPLLKNFYVGLLRTSIDDIYNTTNAWDDSNQNGSVELNEINYNMIRTFSHTNIGLLISKPFNFRKLKLGLNTKFDILSLFDEKSFSHSFDFGIVQEFEKIKIGFVFKDLLNQTYWTTGYKDKINSKFILGTNFDYKSLNTSLDVNILNGDYMFGLSYYYYESISFLLSKNSIEKINLGFIINYKKYNIGYCYIISQNMDLGYSQRFIFGISDL